jgi:hypothetical protein
VPRITSSAPGLDRDLDPPAGPRSAARRLGRPLPARSARVPRANVAPRGRGDDALHSPARVPGERASADRAGAGEAALGLREGRVPARAQARPRRGAAHERRRFLEAPASAHPAGVPSGSHRGLREDHGRPHRASRRDVARRRRARSPPRDDGAHRGHRDARPVRQRPRRHLRGRLVRREADGALRRSAVLARARHRPAPAAGQPAHERGRRAPRQDRAGLHRQRGARSAPPRPTTICSRCCSPPKTRTAAA